MEQPIYDLPVEDQAVTPTPQGYDALQGLFAPPKQNPRVALSVKIAQARAERLEEKRKIDEASIPYVQADIIKSEQSQRTIEQSIQSALSALNAPPPTRGTGSSDAEILAAGIGGLVAPNILPDTLNALMQMSGARNDQEFDDKLRQYGLTRENLQNSLSRFGDDLKYERSNELGMRKANSEAEQFNLGQQLEYDKQTGLNDRAALAFSGKELSQEGQTERKLLGLMATAPDGAKRLEFASMLRELYPDKYENMTDENLLAFAKETSKELLTGAQTALTWEKQETEAMLRDPRRKQILANIDKAIAGTAKTGQETELLKKKVLKFDDEYKLRVANVYSQIANRGSSSDGKAIAANIQDWERLKNMAEESLKKRKVWDSSTQSWTYPNAVGGIDPVALQLESEIESLNQKISGAITKRLQSGVNTDTNPLSPANPLSGNIGKPKPSPGYTNPKRKGSAQPPKGFSITP